MFKKILALMCLTLSIVLFCTAAHATEVAAANINAIYVSGTAEEGGTGVVSAPVSTLFEAYNLLGSNGTIYLMDTVSVSSTEGDCFIAPAHVGKITITSADGYNGALDLTEIKHFHFGGNTEFSNIGIIANDVVLTADNHILTMGEGLEMSSPLADTYRGGHTYSGAKIHLAAYAPCETANVVCETAGGRLNVYSGEYWSVSAWYGESITMTGGETQILLNTQNDTDGIWLRYLCPGMYSSAIENSLTCNRATVTIIVNRGVNTLDAYRFTKNNFSGSLTVNWLLKGSVQGSSYAFLAKDFSPLDNANCTLNVYVDQASAVAKGSVPMLMRGASVDYLGNHAGDNLLSTYGHTHEMHTEQDGRILCVICEYEKCRHLITEDVITQKSTCSDYGVITTYCTDICKGKLYDSWLREYDPEDHANYALCYPYSGKYEYMAFRCKGCNARFGTIDRENICDFIIIGQGGTDYTHSNLPPTDGSPFHFATYKGAINYLKDAVKVMDDITIVFHGDVEIPTAMDIPAFKGTVHITGSEYARLIFNCNTKRIRANSDMLIENIMFAHRNDDHGGIVVCAQNNKLVMGERITIQTEEETVRIGSETVELGYTDLYVIGGFPGANAQGQVIDSDITIRSGSYRFVGGWNYNASTNNGKAKITIGNNGFDHALYIEYLCPFSRGDGYITQPAETTIIIDGGVDVDYFYVTTLNKATLDVPYTTNIVLKGDVNDYHTIDVRGTADNNGYPDTIIKLYVDNRLDTAVVDARMFFRDVSLDTICATAYRYSYEEYCTEHLGGHVDSDGDDLCDECDASTTI